MRGCVWLEPQGKLVPFARSVFEAYWNRDEDLSRDAVLAQCCQRADVDAPGFFAGIAEGNVKEQL
jgi:predicted DsbA family dithiol-disulfide isomerase